MLKEKNEEVIEVEGETKKCPHCGGKAIVWVKKEENKFKAQVECENRILCGSKMSATVASREDAIKQALQQWNRRSNEE